MAIIGCDLAVLGVILMIIGHYMVIYSEIWLILGDQL